MFDLVVHINNHKHRARADMRSFLSIIGQLICYHLLLVTAHDRKHNDRPNDPEYHLITFSSANHDKYAENVMRSAPLAGFNKTKHFKPADLDVDFLRSNTWAFGDITQKDWYKI